MHANMRSQCEKLNSYVFWRFNSCIITTKKLKFSLSLICLTQLIYQARYPFLCCKSCKLDRASVLNCFVPSLIALFLPSLICIKCIHLTEYQLEYIIYKKNLSFQFVRNIRTIGIIYIAPVAFDLVYIALNSKKNYINGFF